MGKSIEGRIISGEKSKAKLAAKMLLMAFTIRNISAAMHKCGKSSHLGELSN